MARATNLEMKRMILSDLMLQTLKVTLLVHTLNSGPCEMMGLVIIGHTLPKQ